MREDDAAGRRLPGALLALAVVSVLATAASIWLYADNRAHLPHPPNYLFGDAVAGVVYPLLGAYLVRRRRDNAVGWVFAGTSVLGLNAFCNQYAVAALLVHPGLPLGSAAAWLASWGWAPELAVPALLPLLFPDGTLPSKRWRGYLRVVLGVLAVLVLGTMFTPAPIDASDAIQNPLATAPIVGVVAGIASAVTLFVLTPISVAALLLRQRRATGVERAQLSWLSLAAVVAIALIVPTNAFPGFWSEVAWTLAVLAIPAGVLIAVVRHQLLDIEVVLNRTVAYAAITAAVLAGYLVAVASVGAAASQRAGIVAVAILALLIASARERVQGWVDRALFGQRKDPYAVVRRVGQRLDAATGPLDALRQLTDELRDALRLPFVAVRATDPGVGEVAVGRPVAGTVEIPVVVLGEQLAVLEVGLRHRGARLTEGERALLADVARRAGALVQAAVLIAELQQSRGRIVAAREEERRRLRRDLHDGIGPELAGMALQLDSLAARLAADPELAERTRRLRDRMRGAVIEVRRVVDDLRPPALDELGLVAALRQHLGVYALALEGASGGGAAGVAVEVPEPLPPLGAATEVAAYRIVAEAVANATRHGRPGRCVVSLSVDSAALTVEVCDDGSGIPADARPGVGLQSMRDRAAEVGGAIELATGPGGTTVRAVLPLEVS